MRVLVVRGLGAASALFLFLSLAACGGNSKVDNTASQVIITPTTLSLNEGAVGSLSVIAENSAGTAVAADISFTSSNPAIATVSTAGLVCAGIWDSNFINCSPIIGQAGVGQVTITATATAFNVSATSTAYVHEQVDQVQAVLPTGCVSMGQPINISGLAFSTTAPGCSPSAPCDITSTVGPFSFGSNDTTIASSSSGLVTTFNPDTNTPVYLSGGTITGTSGQTCNLTNFNTLNGATATVALTGTNTIASGTHLTITTPGSGASSPPTLATLGNGTATCNGTATVQTSITGGVFTAQIPGATTVFASVSGVNSVGTPYLTCPVQSIVVHDANGSNTSFTLAPKSTQALVADVLDTAGQSIVPPLTWATSLPSIAVALPNGTNNTQGTVTAVTGGTAYITTACSNPDCNKGVAPAYSRNVNTINVTQPSATTVYAASTNSTMLVPINSGTNAPGTAITLPAMPNSILADPAGVFVYLGSSQGLMGVTVSSGTIVTSSAAPGSLVAATPDGRFLLISDNTANVVRYFRTADGVITNTTSGMTSSGAFTPDSKFSEWVSGTTLAFGPQAGFGSTITLPASGTAVDISAQGGLSYITSAMAGQIFQYSTCVLTLEQTIPATSPTLLKAIPNGTGAVATDSPNLDVITSPAMLMPGCPVTDQSQINSYDLGAGSFTAQQLLVSPNAGFAYVVPSNLPQVLTFNLTTPATGSVPLLNQAMPFNGGITADSSRLYVGASDGNVHQIDTASMTDAAQVQVNLKDANGNPTVPNLVTVIP